MKLTAIPYRVGQFWNAFWTAEIPAADLEHAGVILTTDQMNLFRRLQTSEQAHAIQVLKTIQSWGEDHPDLLVAGLLHDIGKICHPLRIWERVIIVLGKFLFPAKYTAWGDGPPRGVTRAFVIAAQHPSWGAALAQEAGSTPLVVRLVRRHQEKSPNSNPSHENRLLEILQRADNLN